MARSSSSGGLRALQPENLREQARTSIRAGIITGEIKAGEIYSARTLAEELEVSATPVREALLDLANEGLVSPVRNRGFLVLEVSDHDLDEIFQLRTMLEIPATAQAAKLATEEDVATLRELAERTAVATEQGRVGEFLDADLDFHLHITRRLGNSRLVELVRRLRDQTRLTGLGQLAASGGLEQAVAEHRQLVEAFAAHDSRRAKAIMREHLQHTRGIWAGRDER
jgi:DNA-binding GntR family transcriptional regulator